MKKNKRRYHHQPAKQAHNPAPPSEAIPKDDPPNANQRPTEQKRGKNETGKNLEKGMLRWTRVVGTFTFVLSIVGGIQAWAFIQSERAFLTVAALQFSTGHLAAGVPVVLRVEIRNGGKSTANIEYVNTTTTFHQRLPTIPKYAISPNPSGFGPVVAGGITKGDISMDAPDRAPGPLVLTQADLEMIKNGAIKLFIFGYIEYTDEFSVWGTRKTGFCHIYHPVGAPTDSVFSACKDRAYTYATH